MPFDPVTQIWDSGDGTWLPPLFPKQFEVFNCFHRFVLLCGPRESGKTIAGMHKICRHLWDINNSFVGVFSKTVKSAKDGGSWNDLVRGIMPLWIKSGIGMKFTTADSYGRPGSCIDTVTRAPYFRVRNRWGGESEARLFSIDNPTSPMEIESKTKQLRFSMIYFLELTNFPNRQVFELTIPQLRMEPYGIKPEQHQWMADTNPSWEEGPDSWIYQLFWLERLQADHKNPWFQSQLRVIELFWRDNPSFSPEKEATYRSLYEQDPVRFDCYCNGLWKRGGDLQRHFAKVFRPEIHILGNTSDPNPENWEIIDPSSQCVRLISCWDTGDVNKATLIMEKVEDDSGKLLYFAILAEIVALNEQISTEEFTVRVLQEMAGLEQRIGHPVVWSHWADDSATKQYKSTLDGMESKIVRVVSNNRIILQGVPKDGSDRESYVERRISMVKKLLLRNQLFISAHCFQTIEMLRELRRGRKAPVERTNNPHKHPFDALTYGLQMETVNDLDYAKSPGTSRRTGLIMVA